MLSLLLSATFKKNVDLRFIIKNTSHIYCELNLTYILSFYNKILLILIKILLFVDYHFDFRQNKKHSSLQRNTYRIHSHLQLILQYQALLSFNYRLKQTQYFHQQTLNLPLQNRPFGKRESIHLLQKYSTECSKLGV